MLITVFTATYNRAYILPALYDSLCKQTDKDFEWLIVDDGSTDDTEALVEGWQSAENGFAIRYYRKENGGKSRAVNDGVKLAKGEYFFMVDSDDMIVPEAVSLLKKHCVEIADKEDIIAVGMARGYPDGKYIKGTPPKVGTEGYVDATNLDRDLYDLDADMCEAYKTAVFAGFPMPEWEGEGFAPEQIALNEISLAGYKVRWYTDIIYICDYLEDGLTKGGDLLVAKNPMGYAMMYNHMLKYPRLSVKRKYRAAAQHIALSVVGGNPSYIFKSNKFRYTLLALPLGLATAVEEENNTKNFLGNKKILSFTSSGRKDFLFNLGKCSPRFWGG